VEEDLYNYKERKRAKIPDIGSKSPYVTIPDNAMRDMTRCVDVAIGQAYRLKWLMRVHGLWIERNAWDELLRERSAFCFLEDYEESCDDHVYRGRDLQYAEQKCCTRAQFEYILHPRSNIICVIFSILHYYRLSEIVTHKKIPEDYETLRKIILSDEF